MTDFNLSRIGEMANAAIAREGKQLPDGRVMLKDAPLEIKAAFVELFRLDLMRTVPNIMSPSGERIRMEFDRLVMLLCPELYEMGPGGKNSLDLIGENLMADFKDYHKGEK